MNEYLFDVNLIATIRIEAASEDEARATILDHLDCACVNAGTWSNGGPILFEASVKGEPSLIEINGEPTCHALPNSAFVVW